MRKRTLVGNPCIPDTKALRAMWLAGYLRNKSMKYDDELFLLLLVVFLILGGALLLALLF
jgi:hypothetical protein